MNPCKQEVEKIPKTKPRAHYRWHNEDQREKPNSNATPFSFQKHIIYSAVHIWLLLNVKSAASSNDTLELVESTDLYRFPVPQPGSGSARLCQPLVPKHHRLQPGTGAPGASWHRAALERGERTFVSQDKDKLTSSRMSGWFPVWPPTCSGDGVAPPLTLPARGQGCLGGL